MVVRDWCAARTLPDPPGLQAPAVLERRITPHSGPSGATTVPTHFTDRGTVFSHVRLLMRFAGPQRPGQR